MNHLPTNPHADSVWENVAGTPMTRLEVLERIKEYPEVYHKFLNLSEDFKEELIAFAMGVQGVKMTYDPFFKHIFNPYVRQEVLEDFLSQCLGEKAQILDVFPNESSRIAEDSSLLIADLLVRLQSGALVNVEIQRIGYYFPGARCACYSSDMIMRQYSMARERSRKERKRFSYGDVQKVYTIVFMHESTKEFQKFPNEYLHYAKQTFQTGLDMDLLQEYLLVPLDIFLKIPHNELSKLDAWLYFIASDKIEDIEKVCTAYPEFCDLYRDVFKFRYHPKELVSMFSEALRIMDQNTVQYMIDDLKKQAEISAQEARAAEQKAKSAIEKANEKANSAIERANEKANSAIEKANEKANSAIKMANEKINSALEREQAALEEVQRLKDELERLRKGLSEQ